MKNPFKNDPLGVNSRIQANNPGTAPADEAKKAPEAVPANSGQTTYQTAGKASEAESKPVINLVTLTEYVDDKDQLSSDIKTVLRGDKASAKLVALIARLKGTLRLNLNTEAKADESDIVLMTRYAGQKDKLSEDCFAALSESKTSRELQKLIGVMIATNASFRAQLKNVPALCGKDELCFMFYAAEKNTWYERDADRKADGHKDSTGLEAIWLDKDGRFAGRATMAEVQAEFERLRKEVAQLSQSKGKTT